MKKLLDTHIFLWFIAGDRRLSTIARTAVESTSDSRLFSVAGLWEIAIKVSLGRLELPSPHGAFLHRMLDDTGISLLPILPEHVELVASLPFHHRDPFDRLLVAQAVHEGLLLVSQDPQVRLYDVEVIG
ncbi:type II toxin-antitoxin system VapC family toxin [Myxococcota bacterium]